MLIDSRVSRRRSRHSGRLLSPGVLVWAALVALLPWRAAHAYIDPNAAGPLYQLLFPLLVAFASGLAAFRRAIARAWQRLTVAVLTRRPRSELPPDPRD